MTRELAEAIYRYLKESVADRDDRAIVLDVAWLTGVLGAAIRNDSYETAVKTITEGSSWRVDLSTGG